MYSRDTGRGNSKEGGGLGRASAPVVSGVLGWRRTRGAPTPLTSRTAAFLCRAALRWCRRVEHQRAFLRRAAARAAGHPSPPLLVLSGHAASLTPY